jgi:molybdopterin-guanine dinucleotide biosynthesis protein A
MIASLAPALLFGGVLAGGASRRMGSPKEALPMADGRPMIEKALDAAGAVCGGRVAVAGACSGIDPWPWPRIIRLDDRFPGLGPLAGLEALLGSGLALAWLVAACDQPLLSASVLKPLTQAEPWDAAVFYRFPEQFQPFPGRWPAKWLQAIRQALREERLSVKKLVESMPAAEIVWLEPGSKAVCSSLLDIDTPDDLARL